MTVKGGHKGRFSRKRMASKPRRGKARPKSIRPHHLTPYERLALLTARRRKEREADAVRVAPAPEQLSPALAPEPPPARLAEGVLAWMRRAAAVAVASAAETSRRALRLAARPWHGLAESVRAAFAPVRAEDNRQRGAMAFHGAPRQVSAAPAPTMPEAAVHAVIGAAMAAMPDKGDPGLPDDLGALATLLGDDLPADDFRASDLLRDCFAAFGTAGLPHRALLAVAIRLTANFGMPGRLPLASDRAWRMLDPATFEDEMAGQLAAIKSFISDWQKTQQSFLCLEFAEIGLIEWLFECLHPGRHGDLLFEVMNFKVLSNRRQGILRRIPHRVRKMVKDLGGGPEAVLYAAGAHAYLDRVATTHGFTPIVETALACRDEVEKVLEKLRPPALPDGSGAAEGQALARINPVKMPASEVGTQSSPPAAAPLAPPPPPQPLASRPLPPAMPPLAGPLPSVPPLAGLPPAPRPEAEGVRAATVRLQPKHMRSGAELTIPSRSAGRIPLGRMFSCEGGRSEAAVPAISVRSEQTRPGLKPTRFPEPVNAAIPASLPHLALPKPDARPAPETPPAPPRTVSGRISLGQPAATVPVPAARAPARPAVVLKPQAPKPQPAPLPPPLATPLATPMAAAPPPALAENVTKLTMVQKRRLPITQALKRQSVMRVLRGEDPEQVAQAIGIGRHKLDEWVDKFVAAGAGALTSGRKRKTEELTVDTLRAKLAEVLATAQMIEQVMEASLPRRPVLLPPPAGKAAPPPPRRPRGKQG